MRLEPLFVRGWIEFYTPEDNDLKLLIQQLKGFPNYPNDDGPDALTGAVDKLRYSNQDSDFKTGEGCDDFGGMF